MISRKESGGREKNRFAITKLVMLKITVTDSPLEQRWILYGRLTGPWASELESNWSKTRGARQGRRCIVDLENVTFIDQDGERVLLAMMREEVLFVARGVCTKQLLADLKSENKCRLRK